MRKQAEDKLFRVYLTDGLKAVADNTARLTKEGVSLKLRYVEIADNIKTDKPEEKPEEKPKETAEQIINRISAGLNALAAKKEGSSADNDAGQ